MVKKTTTKRPASSGEKFDGFKPYRTIHSYRLKTTDMEVGGGESLTIPDDAISIKELLMNYVKGIPDLRARNAQYASAEPDFEDYDPTQDPDFDLADYASEMERIQALRRKVEPSSDSRSEKELADATAPTEGTAQGATEAQTQTGV